MSQYTIFNTGSIPGAPNVEFIQGTSGAPVPPDPATHIITETSGLVSNDIALNDYPATHTIDLVDLVKYTPYVVDNASFLSVINFDINFVALNSIVATVDTVALAPVVFAVNQATTIAALASTISGAAGVLRATVTGTRQITVQFSGGVHTVDSVITTLGATQPVATITQSLSSPYYTIQSAINAASTAGGGVVAVRWNGTNYIENLTLEPNVDLFAVSTDPRNTSPIGCVIEGNHALGTAGVLHIEGFYLYASAGDSVTINNAAGLARIYFDNCVIDAAGKGIVCNSAAGSAQAFLSTTDIVAAGLIADLSGGGYLTIFGGTQVGTYISAGTAAVVVARNAQIQGTSFTIDILSATASIDLLGCTAISGGPVINFAAAGSATVHHCVFDTSTGGGYFVAGAGTFTYADIISVGSAIAIDPATTVVVNDWKPHSTQGTSVTGIKGTASFNQDHFTVVDGFVSLEGRHAGTAQTIGAVTADVITLALGATPGTYTLESRVAGFESSTPASAGFQIFGTVRTDGVTATLVGTPDIVDNTEAALASSLANIVVSGNNAIIRVTGVALLTIDWAADLDSTFRG